MKREKGLKPFKIVKLERTVEDARELIDRAKRKEREWYRVAGENETENSGNNLGDSSKGNGRYKGQFKKFHEPWNKGLKGLRTSPRTEFKKGNVPRNALKPSTIKYRYHKRSKKLHRWIKGGDSRRMEPMARYVWRKHYGFIIEGDVIFHIDGNHLNDNIENLIAIPRSVLPRYQARWKRDMTVEDVEEFKERYR